MEHMTLRQIGDAFGTLQQRYVRAAKLAQRELALRGFDPTQSAQQRGFAGAVRSDQRHHLAALQLERHVINDRAAAEPHGEGIRGEQRRAHAGDPSSVRRSRKIIARKNGTPTSALTTQPLSSWAAGTARTAMSAAVSSAAPTSADGSNTRAGSDCTVRRTRCGATRPVKAIQPDTATA